MLMLMEILEFHLRKLFKKLRRPPSVAPPLLSRTVILITNGARTDRLQIFEDGEGVLT